MKGRDTMKRLLAVLMIVAILVSCTSPALAKKGKRRTKSRKQQPKQEQSAYQKLPKSADLYDKNMSDWKRAARNEKVATCEIIIAGVALKGVLNIRVTTDTLKNYAEVLAGTMDSLIEVSPNDKKVLNCRVMDAAIVCMAYLGWIKGK